MHTKLRVFTLLFNASQGGFDASGLHEFCEHHHVVSVVEHFTTGEGLPVWCLLVTYKDVVRGVETARWERDRGRDPRDDLAADEQALYDALRAWRSERSKREGKAPYLLFTNAQLADIARLRPGTAAALGDVRGVGEAKAAALGEEVVALVAAASAAPKERADG